MSDVLSDARRLIEDRLAELDAEAKQLRAALESLGGDQRPVRGRRSAGRTRSRARPRGTGNRAPRGQRQAQFLAALEKNPGAKASAIAKEIGVTSSQAHGLAQALHKAGKIRKRRGGGYALKT